MLLRLTSRRVRVEGQPQRGLTSANVFAVLQRERATVGFGNLPAQHEADAAAAGLRGEERNEEVVAVKESGALVADEDFDRVSVHVPAYLNRAGRADRRVERGVNRIADDVDEQLLKLVGIAVERDFVASHDLDREPRFESRSMA